MQCSGRKANSQCAKSSSLLAMRKSPFAWRIIHTNSKHIKVLILGEQEESGHVFPLNSCSQWGLKISSVLPRLEYLPPPLHNLYSVTTLFFASDDKLNWSMEAMSCGSVGRVGCKLIIKVLSVQIPAPAVHMLTCPGSRHWTPISPNGGRQSLAGGSHPLVCECEWMGHCGGAEKCYKEQSIYHLSPQCVHASVFI